jgi:hypothetical protein
MYELLYVFVHKLTLLKVWTFHVFECYLKPKIFHIILLFFLNLTLPSTKHCIQTQNRVNILQFHIIHMLK